MITMNWYIKKLNLFKCHGWFNILFIPLGCKVLRHLIHLSLCDSKIGVIFPNGALSLFSMMVNFACIKKLWLDWRKCCSTGSSLSISVYLILCL